MKKVQADAARLDESVDGQGGEARRPRYDSGQSMRLRAINWVGSTEELGVPPMDGTGIGSLRMGRQYASGRQAGSTLPGRTLVLKKQK